MSKYLFILLSAFLPFSCMHLTYTNKGLKQPPPENIYPIENLRSLEIYSTNWHSLKQYIKCFQKRINVIVSYTYWCPSSKYSFNEFVKLELDTSVNVFFITADDWYYIPQYKDYLYTKGYSKPSFIIDIVEYGNKFNPHPKYKKFFKEICLGCDSIGGFPSYIVLDKNLDVLYAKSGLLDSTTYKIINRN